MPFFPIINLPTNSLPSLAYDLEGVLFMAEIDPNEQVYIKKSIDQGENWSSGTLVTNATSAHKPAVACVGEKLLIAWTANDGSDILYFTISTNGGESFYPIQPLNGALTKHAPNMTGGTIGAVSFISLNGEAEMVTIPSNIT
ncbi:MAG: hypothetical protein JJ909_05770 [Roseivirga sp.]|jgi:hypothetical protein|uniref:hypothetical protein n=1 Tax=Roseivirga sp. TaxID=1964215 RepID=UPI001B20653D|nr:hypothetical protein [Roseivirga sp.]MBO6659103.1 hypothetical protein [Roseivirga sp.]MBO6760467.1 hypothetical protein [Roseivirga sp.]MBO6908160.1 hypothetical protein [Roseivirga sp.]